MNFSLHESDLSRFENDWNKVKSFVRSHGLDGVELFIDHNLLPDFPSGIVKGVHLPYWMGRHRAWMDEKLSMRIWMKMRSFSCSEVMIARI